MARTDDYGASMSEHAVRIVRLGDIRKHPNADTLGITTVEGYQVVVRMSDWTPGQLAMFIEPDYIVPEREEFAFLGRHRRIGAKRLRGEWSYGLLMPAPTGAQEGDDVMAAQGIERWQPPEPGEPHRLGGPRIERTADFTVYDLEGARKYLHLLREGELVHVTEKIHGANARYCFDGEKMLVGARRNWRSADDPSARAYFAALEQNPWIVEWCQDFPGSHLIGEVFGQVQDLKYGAAPGQVMFRAFDVVTPGGVQHRASFLLRDEWCVPEVEAFRWRPDAAEYLIGLASGQSLVPGANHLREGVVVRPTEDRMVNGRPVALKIVSPEYLSRKTA